MNTIIAEITRHGRLVNEHSAESLSAASDITWRKIQRLRSQGLTTVQAVEDEAWWSHIHGVIVYACQTLRG